MQNGTDALASVHKRKSRELNFRALLMQDMGWRLELVLDAF